MANRLTATRPRFFSPKELGKRWGRNRITIIRAIEAGKLHAVRLSNRGSYMIPVGEVERIERGLPRA